MTRALVIGALALVTAACGAATAGSGSGATSQQSAGMHNAISSAELSSAREQTLYEAIQRLRPSFYRSRQVRSSSTPNPEPVHVYIDGARVEGVDALKLISPKTVQEVRFYEPQDANVRFGTGHHGGLINVVTIH